MKCERLHNRSDLYQPLVCTRLTDLPKSSAFCLHIGLPMWVPSLFVPGPIRSLERIGQQDPGQFAAWPIPSLTLSLRGHFVPWNFRRLALSLPKI